MALNHIYLKTILHSIPSQLHAIRTHPTPIIITFTGCHMGKLSLQPHKRVRHTFYVGEVIFTDVCGPMRTTGQSFQRYIITFTDIGSRYTFISPNRSRSQVPDLVSRAVTYVHCQIWTVPELFTLTTSPNNFDAQSSQSSLIHVAHYAPPSRTTRKKM